MKQLTLFESFARKSRLPLELSKILHSFLPTDEELFCEQRFRFLLTNVLSEDEYSVDEAYETLPYVTFFETDRYRVVLVIDIDTSIRYNKRKFAQTVEVTWHVSSDHPLVQNADGVELEDKTEELLPENIGSILKKLYLPTILDAARRNKRMRTHFQTWNVPPFYDLTKIQGDVFMEIPDYKKWGTEREDGKKVFWPRISLENLHLLL